MRKKLINLCLKGIQFILFAVIVFGCQIGCSRYYQIEKKLPQIYRDFLSEVRYIITSVEKKSFLDLTGNESREQFIKEFWKKRDPDPDTDKNEYQETYYERIEEAARLFQGEGVKGWQTERGRAYVMLGPPENRRVFPQGYSFYGPAVEIWYYGMFPIIFVDQHREGIYKLDYSNSAAYIQYINNAEMQLHPQSHQKMKNAQIKVRVSTETAGQAVFDLDVPYAIISFEKKGKLYQAAVNITVSIKNEAGEMIDKSEQSFPLSVSEKDLGNLKEYFPIHLSFELNPGKYQLEFEVKDHFGTKSMSKVIGVKIK
jgi:GWxTD domain-containing protein